MKIKLSIKKGKIKLTVNGNTIESYTTLKLDTPKFLLTVNIRDVNYENDYNLEIDNSISINSIDLKMNYVLIENEYIQLQISKK
ncbi:MAG: hypothetical protein JHC31_15005 [Sulfurihydrogenibium sp.]|nr:hypothetical protein [Sulfurihydrogenibium sp.]